MTVSTADTPNFGRTYTENGAPFDSLKPFVKSAIFPWATIRPSAHELTYISFSHNHLVFIELTISIHPERPPDCVKRMALLLTRRTVGSPTSIRKDCARRGVARRYDVYVAVTFPDWCQPSVLPDLHRIARADENQVFSSPFRALAPS